MKLQYVIRCVFALALLSVFLALPLGAQGLFGAITDAPQHVIAAGGGCDGNKQCSADVGYAEKIGGATYSYSSVEFVPSFTTNAAGQRIVNIKSVAGTGVQQLIAQGGQWTLAAGVTGGAALPTADAPTFNFASTEHLTFAWRLKKAIGDANNYLAITPYFTQISGVPNGQTFAVRLHFLHSMK